MTSENSGRFNHIKERIRCEFSHLRFHEKNGLFEIEIISQGNQLRATFRNPWTLQTLLDEFVGFKSVAFPGSKIAILFDNTLYVFGRIVSNREYEAPVEKFTMATDKYVFDILATDTFRLYNHLHIIQQEELSFDDFKRFYPEYVEERLLYWPGGASSGWTVSHLLMLLNSTEIDIPPGLPPDLVNYHRWNMLFQIRPKEATKTSELFLSENSDSIINFLCFEYFRNHGLFIEVADIAKFSWHPNPIDWNAVIPQEREPRMKETQFRILDPILMEHLKAAEHSSIPSFQFLSLYHILEHFFDAIAMQDLIEEITKSLESPDFSARKDWYARTIASSLVEGHPNRLEEKAKLRGVLTKFIPFLFKDQIPDNLKKHIRQSAKFIEGLVLDPISAKSREIFFSSLANRIYNLRCAIVHSNPTYDRTQSHVGLSEENMKIVSKEVDLLRLIVIEIIQRHQS